MWPWYFCTIANKSLGIGIRPDRRKLWYRWPKELHQVDRDTTDRREFACSRWSKKRHDLRSLWYRIRALRQIHWGSLFFHHIPGKKETKTKEFIKKNIPNIGAKQDSI
jgi:hypothetical protein